MEAIDFDDGEDIITLSLSYPHKKYLIITDGAEEVYVVAGKIDELITALQKLKEGVNAL